MSNAVNLDQIFVIILGLGSQAPRFIDESLEKTGRCIEIFTFDYSAIEARATLSKIDELALAIGLKNTALQVSKMRELSLGEDFTIFSQSEIDLLEDCFSEDYLETLRISESMIPPQWIEDYHRKVTRSHCDF